MIALIRRHWVRLRQQPERGSANIELVLATPLMLLCLLTVVQAGLWMHATHIAQAAAQQSLEAARAHHGSEADGYTTAQQALDQLAGGTLKDGSVEVHRDGAEARVEIRGWAAAIVPGIRLPVRAQVAGGVERFVPADTQ